MTSPDASDPSAPIRRSIPLTTWARPALLLTGGLLGAILLMLADQPIGAVAIALFTLFMAYWTSPLRTGPHTPWATALTRRGDDVALVLWAPGNPLSARLQTAIRGPREDVVWVNTYKDPDAQQFLAEHGGADALPLVIVGSEITRSATATQLMDMQAAGARRGRGGDQPEG